MALMVLHYLCLLTLLAHNLASSTTVENEEPRRTFPFRRAIDGTRGRKFYDPEEDGFPHSYGSSGRYDPDHQINDFSDIRNNVPGEPGVDYPSYTRLPETGFVCEAEFRGYYADEAAGCQVFHVCDGNFLVSSFLCPMGSIFSQKLLTCDWWSKVDCSATRSYHSRNIQSLVSDIDDDEILRKAFEMASVQSAGERIPADTVSHHSRHRVPNYPSSTVTERSNDLQTGPDNYSDYPEYQSRPQFRFQPRAGQKSRQRHRDDDYYTEDDEEDSKQRKNSPIRVHTVGEDVRNDRAFRNEFQPSYAPTVPTVITTTRRFYSPTFPTTYRPSTEREPRRRFDLEFESSDHLYNARGRSDETAKAPTAFPHITTRPESISLPILVNSADERRDEVENMQESESSFYRTTVTLPSARTSSIEPESSTKASVSNTHEHEITETLSILTIGNENHNPNAFAYNHKEDKSPRNDTHVLISSTLPAVNFSKATSTEVYRKPSKIAAFLEPPQELANQFRITVLDEATAPKEASESVGLDENNSDSGVELIKSVELPDIHVTPPVIDGSGATRESRLIRLFLNKDDNSSSSTLNSIVSDDSISPLEDNEAEHSEIKLISEKLPDEHKEFIEKISENDNSTSNVEADLSDGAATAKSEDEKTDVIDAALAIEESELGKVTQVALESNSTVAEEKQSEDRKIADQSLLKSNATEKTNFEGKANEQSSRNTETLLNDEIATSEEKTQVEVKTQAEQKTQAEEMTQAEEKTPKSSAGDKLREILPEAKATNSGKNDHDDSHKEGESEESLLEKKTAPAKENQEHLLDDKPISSDEKKSTAFEKLAEILSNPKVRVAQENDNENNTKISSAEETLPVEPATPREKSVEDIDSEKTLLDTKKLTSADKISEGQPIDSEEIVKDVEATVSNEKTSDDKHLAVAAETASLKTTISQEKSIELSIDNEDVSLNTRTTVLNEKSNDDGEHSTGIDESLRNAKVEDHEPSIDSKESSPNAKAAVSSEQTSLNTKASVSDNKKYENHEPSSGSEEPSSNSTASASNEKSSEIHDHSIVREDSSSNTKATVPSEQASQDTKTTTKNVDNHERSSRSDEIAVDEDIEDSMVEASSPFQLTVTVNKDEELDPHGEVIRELIAKQKIGDLIAAADYRSFEIVKSDEPKASNGGFEASTLPADSRSSRRTATERDSSEERLPNFRSNSLRSREYYRSIVGLVNGPNVPRPFSLEAPHNVEVRTPSDVVSDSAASTRPPIGSGTFGNDLVSATTRITVPTTVRSIASSLHESESLEKLSASSKSDVSSNEELLDQLSSTFGERQPKAKKEKLIFELPQEQRSLDFRTGNPLDVSLPMKSLVDETSEGSKEKSLPKTLVETELIPSISFSLNTEEEREEYMEAVARGLLPDIRATESTNDTKISGRESDFRVDVE